MKKFKLISKIFIVILLICSIALNYFIYSTSYGTLAFKYDKEKYLSMINAEQISIGLNLIHQRNFKAQIEETIQYKEKDREYSTTKAYNLNFDKDGNLTAHYTSVYKSTELGTDNIGVYYLVDGIEYAYYGPSRKVKKPVSKNSLLGTMAFYVGNYQNSLMIDINKNDTKPKIKFDISSFSFLFIFDLEIVDIFGESTYFTFEYNTKGKLEKLTIIEDDGIKYEKQTYKYSYKNKKIDLPDLSEYVEVE